MDGREQAQFRVDGFIPAPDGKGAIVTLTILNTGRRSVWLYGPPGWEPCEFFQQRKAGQWSGQLMSHCDMSPQFNELAANDSVLVHTGMGLRDTVRVGYIVTSMKPKQLPNREEMLRLIRWSDAIVFDSTRVMTLEEGWRAKGDE
jgi:hypothetical protein